MITREPIYAALFNLLKGAANFKTASRTLAHWSALEGTKQPAIFQAQKGETVTAQRSMPSKYQLSVDIYIYAQSDDKDVPPSSILNPLIDAVEAALAPNPATGVQTLGCSGVSSCRIEGKIETDEGVLGNQAVAIIPVTIVAAG